MWSPGDGASGTGGLWDRGAWRSLNMEGAVEEHFEPTHGFPLFTF